jgi:hypothetical protein
MRFVVHDACCRLLKSAAEEFPTPTPPPVPTGIEFASSDEEDGEEPPPPPPLFPADFFSPSGSGGDVTVSPDFLQRTPPPPLPLPPLPPPLDVSSLARELQVQGLSEEEQVAIAMEERCCCRYVSRSFFATDAVAACAWPLLLIARPSFPSAAGPVFPHR